MRVTVPLVPAEMLATVREMSPTLGAVAPQGSTALVVAAVPAVAS